MIVRDRVLTRGTGCLGDRGDGAAADPQKIWNPNCQLKASFLPPDPDISPLSFVFSTSGNNSSQ